MTLEEKSYVFGLLMSDGNLSLAKKNPNKGKVTLEIAERDRDIVEKLYRLVPDSSIHSRTRNTNFKKDYQSVKFSNSKKEFRNELIGFGFPITNKTLNANIPSSEYSERDFWRGIIDGDGSLGLSNSLKGPFISLVTKSEDLKNEFCKFLLKFGIMRETKRNKRDGVYNIMVTNEEAIVVMTSLYKDCCCCIDRKFEKYTESKEWKRPITSKRRKNIAVWTEEELRFIESHTIEESLLFTNKSKKQIKSKLANCKFRSKIGEVIKYD